MTHWYGLALVLLLPAAPACAWGQTAAPAKHVEEVPGFGRTVEDAKQDARGHVLVKLQELLRDHDPPLVWWEPSLADVERLIRGPGRLGKSFDNDSIGYRFQWLLPVRFPSREELERRERSVQRIWLTAQASGVILGVMAVYLLTQSLRRGRKNRSEQT